MRVSGGHDGSRRNDEPDVSSLLFSAEVVDLLRDRAKFFSSRVNLAPNRRRPDPHEIPAKWADRSGRYLDQAIWRGFSAGGDSLFWPPRIGRGFSDVSADFPSANREFYSGVSVLHIDGRKIPAK
jgi:hypothetical protein